MANKLSTERQAMAVSALVEGSSIRSVERMTGIHRDTVMRLGLRVGQACAQLLDETMRELPCEKVEVDEIWGFVGKKQKQVTAADSPEMGDVWTFVAIDPDTKVVPTFLVGKRDCRSTDAFIADLSSRVSNRLKICSDAMPHYTPALERAFGGDVDYGQVTKTIMETPNQKVEPIRRVPVIGQMEEQDICTSFVERQNLTMRMHMRRLTRLTNGFSKKLENFHAAVALHFGYYNFVKVHSSIRCTPSMAAGVSQRVWTVNDLVALSA